MPLAYRDNVATKPGRAKQRDWRPVVSRWTFRSIQQALMIAGIYWYYTNRLSGDLVLRFEAVILVLTGIWAGHLVQVKPEGDADAV